MTELKNSNTYEIQSVLFLEIVKKNGQPSKPPNVKKPSNIWQYFVSIVIAFSSTL